MSTRDWTVLATLTAEHAGTLDAASARALLDDQIPVVVVTVGNRADLSPDVAVAAIDWCVNNGRTTLSQFAGNWNLPAAAQRHLADVLVTARGQENNPAETQLVTKFAEAVTDPVAVAALVEAACAGAVPDNAWRLRLENLEPAPEARFEHAAAVLARRPEIDDVLTRVDFAGRLLARLHAETAVRGRESTQPGGSVVADAVHTYGLRHPAQYAALTCTQPHPGLLRRWARHPQPPALVRSLLLDTIVTKTRARLSAGQPLDPDTNDLVYAAWPNLHADAKDAVRAALRTGDLSTSPRHSWLTEIAYPVEPTATAEWTRMPVSELVATLDRARWKLPRDEVYAVLARTDVPTVEAVKLVTNVSPHAVPAAPQVRAFDRDFLIAWYCRLPGTIDQIDNRDLLFDVTKTYLGPSQDNPQHRTSVLKSADVVTKLGALVWDLPWPVLTHLAGTDAQLARAVADHVAAVLNDPVRAKVISHVLQRSSNCSLRTALASADAALTVTT